MMKCVNLVVICAWSLAFAPMAAGQTAPEGNAHPATRAVSGDAGELRNPFDAGAGAGTSTMDVDRKRAFAQAVNLEPLRDLAVFHDGRVKILGTLADETVRSITGRKDYFDIKTTGDGGALRLRYDPLFTLMDLVIDPGYYEDKSLVLVNFLPLREKLIEAAYTEPSEREWWLRQGRLKPSVIRAHAAGVMDEVMKRNSASQTYLQGMKGVASAMDLFEQSWRNFEMVAPERADQPWAHVGRLDPASPAGKAVADLVTGWKAGDATKVNAAAAALATELPKINPAWYPTSRRQLEATYNKLNPFEYAYWVYFLSLLTLLLGFGTGRRWLGGVGVTALAVAMSLHAFGFIARCIIAERFAIQNQFESMTGVSLFATTVGLALMVARRQMLFGAAGAGVGFLVLIAATQTGIPGVNIEREAAILNTSVLLKYHVTTVLVSYGLISLGFILSLFYLGTYYATRYRVGGAGGAALAGVAAGAGVGAAALGLGDDVPHGPQRVLGDLDRAQMIVLQLAFWALGVGILLGAWWADHSWGRWWAFDPKEIWALVTWIVYLVVIHLRFTQSGPSRALTTSWLSVLGFFVMLWCYFGVNLLLPGLHAYA
jgi:ABC-type transport system involved in cytochrome c biogenesis permease subunit